MNKARIANPRQREAEPSGNLWQVRLAIKTRKKTNTMQIKKVFIEHILLILSSWHSIHAWLRGLFIIILLVLTTTIQGNKLHNDNHNFSDKIDKLKTDSFNHSKTSFPLVGNHKIIDCKRCHLDSVLSKAGKKCISCHSNVHNNILENDCESCHNSETWKKISFNHSTTSFSLKGKHQKVNCYQCHKHDFNNTPTACISCHLSDNEKATNPNHANLKFPSECQNCHNSESWSDTNFNHSVYTKFKLTEKHMTLTCKKCHPRDFQKPESSCISCHLFAYQQTKNPNHELAVLSKDCELCHNQTLWKPSIFNHNSGTSFPLHGAHLKADCSKCHSSNFAKTPTACVSCHLKNYLATKNPDHVQANFSKECQNCHTTSGRSPSKFDHNTATNFPLKNSHVGVECKICHTNGYKGRSTLCISCHLKEYNKVIYPNHVAANFSKECQLCHNDKKWEQSIFNHNTTTTFPLTGSHIGIDCRQCHTTVFSGTSSECYSCHQKDYNNMISLSHEKSKFPTSCKNCHSTTAWKKTNFNHDRDNFPIFSKTHKEKWITCNDCHSNLSNFIEFSCIKCHKHADKQESDSVHIKVSNYTYAAKSCLSCHPKGLVLPHDSRQTKPPGVAGKVSI